MAYQSYVQLQLTTGLRLRGVDQPTKSAQQYREAATLQRCLIVKSFRLRGAPPAETKTAYQEEATLRGKLQDDGGHDAPKQSPGSILSPCLPTVLLAQ